MRSSAVGGDFTPASFLRTPVSTLRWLLQRIDDTERSTANQNSSTTAVLAAVVIQIAHGMSGSKRAAPKVQARNFLPYPDWKPTTAPTDGPNAPTRFILSELVRTRRVPMHVYAALAANTGA